MGEENNFLVELNSGLSELHKLLSYITRQEELLKSNVLVKKGFLIKKYSIKKDSIKPNKLSDLKKEIKKLKIIESKINYKLKEHKNKLNILENDYNAKYSENLNLKKMINEGMNNCFYLSDLLIVRINEIVSLLNNKKEISAKILLSFERMVNQIIRFTSLIEQLTIKMSKFQKNDYWKNARTYGRAMSKKEEAQTISMKKLLGSPKRRSEDLIGVFDATTTVRNKIITMNDDQKKNFFGQIGVVGGTKVIFFETRLKAVNFDRPIIQSNGLREYKFPKGISIEILEAA